MEAAFQYVLEKVNRGMRIQGMYRQASGEFIENNVPTQTTQSPTQTTQGTTQTIQSPTQTTQDTTQTQVFSYTENDKAVLSLVHKYPEMTQKELAMELGWTVDRVKYYLNKMKKKQIIRRVGSSHTGHWELLIEKPWNLSI